MEVDGFSGVQLFFFRVYRLFTHPTNDDTVGPRRNVLSQFKIVPSTIGSLDEVGLGRYGSHPNCN